MISRDPEEEHRAATPLELLYDLCFVVAIAQAASGLHHGISHGHPISIMGYAIVFFAIWWAWMGFAWFASAFDTDDVAYRLKVLLQIVGVLVLAAGVPRAAAQQDFGFITLGYVIMRIGLIAQWLRAARADPAYRRTALRFVTGIVVCQVGWVALLLAPDDRWVYGFLMLAPLELLVPVWAEQAGRTQWHPRHIAERYGLFTIIVIGESVLAATLAVQAALDAGSNMIEVAWIIAGAPLIIFSMWWLYFLRPANLDRGSLRQAFVWSYSHYFIFGSAAAVGSGIAVAVDHAVDKSHISSFWAGQALAIPVAVYLVSTWYAHLRPCDYSRRTSYSFLVAAGLTLLAPLAPADPLVIGLILAGLTGFLVTTSPCHQRN